MEPRTDVEGAGFAATVRRHLVRVWHFCHRMTLDQGDAEDACFETFARAHAAAAADAAAVAAGAAPPVDGADARAVERRLLALAAEAVTRRVPQALEVTFDRLDETLRSEATRTGEVASITNPEREFLLWELKQGCMTAVVNCLPPGERAAFVIASVLGLSEEEGARVLGINPSAFKVRLSRARQKVGDYLAPRCEHVDPRNPCHCPSRIGVALRKGFIAPPTTAEVTLHKRPPFVEGQRQREAVGIYRTLPEPEPPIGLLSRVEAALATGRWDDPAR